jgi:hypothetical protein
MLSQFWSPPPTPPPSPRFDATLETKLIAFMFSVLFVAVVIVCKSGGKSLAVPSVTQNPKAYAFVTLILAVVCSRPEGADALRVLLWSPNDALPWQMPPGLIFLVLVAALVHIISFTAVISEDQTATATAIAIVQERKILFAPSHADQGTVDGFTWLAAGTHGPGYYYRGLNT